MKKQDKSDDYTAARGLAQAKARAKSPRGKDLGGERAVMRQAARRNRPGGLNPALVNVTYRDTDGNLENTVLNRPRQAVASGVPRRRYNFM